MHQIVLCRYAEAIEDFDTEWLTANTIVYNKGNEFDLQLPCGIIETLPNVGREGQAFLHHIVTNYDTLPEVLICGQARMNDCVHLPLSLYREAHGFRAVVAAVGHSWLGAADGGQLTLPDRYRDRLQNGTMHGADCGINEFYTRHLGRLPATCITVLSGVFAVTKATVLRRPLCFYARLLSHFSQHAEPEAGHFLERLWLHVFMGQDVPDGLQGPRNLGSEGIQVDLTDGGHTKVEIPEAAPASLKQLFT